MTGFDSELDALFKSSAGAELIPKPPIPPTGIPTPAVPASPEGSTSAPTKRKHKNIILPTGQSGTKRRKPNLLEPRAQGKKPEADSSEADDPVVEDAYYQQKSKTALKNNRVSEAKVPDAESHSESDSDTDLDAPPPLHESLTRKPQGERTRKKKYIPEDETTEQKNSRTIFIGNLPAGVAKSSTRKSLQKHVLKCLASTYPNLPRPKIESSRFRSVAFSTPTNKLPSDALSSKPQRETPSSEHHRTRAAEWRAAQDPEGTPHKTFQTPAQKKKTAYITGALHDSTKSSASAYVVFAYPDPVEGGEPAWDPVEVAARAVLACNGSTFMDRVLRVDRVGQTEGDKPDPRTMVFIGNLDFEVDENAVRELFEKLVEKERGKSDAQDGSGSESGDSESEEEAEEETGAEITEPNSAKTTSTPLDSTTTNTWVKSVRIIRDKDTQLGKGFGYVQFIDRASADEILAMEPGTIKLAKRKLRVQRCKTVPGVSLQKPKASHADKIKDSKDSSEGGPSSKPGHQKPRVIKSTPVIPRADPGLGERIRTMSKKERKSVKASDADRVARRLAKKKAKIVAERGARKEGSRSKANILGGRPGGPKSNKPKPGKSAKRERSDNALLKKNVKNHCMRDPAEKPLLTTMCLAFWTLTHPQYAVVIASNRDEFLSRPTVAADWHNFDATNTGSEEYVLSGRDAIAGGTWLGINRKGDIALLTNIAEPGGNYTSSRGDLTSNFLISSNGNFHDRISPYVETLLSQQRSYAGFNMPLLSPTNISGRFDYRGVMVTNSQGGGEITTRPLSQRECLACGLSNSSDSTHEPSDKTEWPKVSEGRKLFEQVISRDDLDDDGLIEALCQIMSVENPIKPTTRYGLRTTISVPPIPVEPEAWLKTLHPSEDNVPASTDAAPALNSENRRDYYATRLTSIILVRRDGRATFVERDVWVQKNGAGEPEKCLDIGLQRRFDFQIED
ncbi:unnamed protein product [Rhizoctonia solani]|uniref:RRM domain-containing protein n=1 Tax=Rhizoctonia solani TaxID=456999 RepID=A0A8H2ZXU4_9AGAM|nr:unnamed protein product [Rhizoctonia solani]